MGLLSVDQLSVGYGEQNVVKNCSFTLLAGEIIVVLGASGDGKTTLLKAIAGLLPHTSGQVNFNGEQVRDSAKKLVPGHELIKLVNQDFNLDEFHTVEENIRLRLLAFDRGYQQDRINQLLRLTKLTAYRNKKATQISGGQRQRLAIARALADEPELVLLDEPFNQLDFQTKASMASHIKSYLRKNTIGAIMVTHNGIEALEWADRILFMKKGKIVRSDTPQNFYNSPQSIQEARFFGEVNKVALKGQMHYFRPSFYALRANNEHSLPLEIKFKSVQQLGWYAAYTFLSGKSTVVLYATQDISHLKKVFIRTFLLND